MAALKELIQAATIARVSRKADGKFLGWGVKSNHSNDYYHVACHCISGERVWSCTCYAGQHNFVGCKQYGHCCHVEAVIQVEQARRETTKAQATFVNFFAALAQFASEQKAEREQAAQSAMVEAAQAAIFPKAKKAAVKRAPQFANLPLNGRGFVMQAVPELGGRVVPM